MSNNKFNDLEHEVQLEQQVSCYIVVEKSTGKYFIRDGKCTFKSASGAWNSLMLRYPVDYNKARDARNRDREAYKARFEVHRVTHNVNGMSAERV